MSGHKQHKKNGARKEKQVRARHADLDQPISGAVSKQQGRDVSNFTDGEIAGPDWRKKLRQRG